MRAEAWAFIAGVALLALLSGFAARALKALGLERPNFRGETIPVGLGLIVLIWSASAFLALAARSAGGSALRRESLAAYASVVVGMGALGLLDDLFGDRSATGMRGHLRALYEHGRITTGLVKAAGGVGLALFVSMFVLKQSGWSCVLSAAVIALSSNAVNLLDLRPGRACAAFLVCASLLLAKAWGDPGTVAPLLIVCVPTVVVYERDARGLAMLGDCGSNLLGGVLGLTFILEWPSVGARSAALCALILFHLAAERWSLSELIEKQPLLRRLDRLTGVR